MLRCLNMLEEFQRGTIRIDGQEIGYDSADGAAAASGEARSPASGR